METFERAKDVWRKFKECIHTSQSTSKQGLYENQYEESLLKGFDMQTERMWTESYTDFNVYVSDACKHKLCICPWFSNHGWTTN